MESAERKVKKKGRGKKSRKKEKESSSVESIETGDSSEQNVAMATDNNAFEADTVVQEPSTTLDTTINIDDEATERPSMSPKSDSLKEIVVHSPKPEAPEDIRAQSPDVAIDIPDSPRTTTTDEPVYNVDGEQVPIETKEPEIENMEKGVSDLPDIPQRNSPLQRNSSRTPPDSPQLALASARLAANKGRALPQLPNSPKSSSPVNRTATPTENETAPSEERSSTPQLPNEEESERPSSTERPGSADVNERPPSATSKRSTTDRPSSGERPSSASKKPSSAIRPSSAQSTKSDASTSERPSSGVAENPVEDSVMEEQQVERPLSATRNKRPSSASKASEVEPERKLSRDAIVEEEEEVSTKEPEIETEQPQQRQNLEPAGNDVVNGEEENFQPPEESPKEEVPVRTISSPPPDLPGEDDELPWAMYNKMKSRDEEKKEDDDADDEMDEGNESVDDDYEPPTNEDLPDLYETMDALDNDEIELNQKTIPPSILDSDQQKVYNQKVDDLKQGLAEEEIQVYLDEFEKQVEQEILMIGNISLEDVQDEEKRLREEHITFQQEQAKVQRKRQEEILQAMERAKKYVMNKYKEKYREIRMREQHLMQKDRTYKDEIHRAFRRSESQLRKALKRRKAEVKTMYGDLILADGQYGGSKGRRWKIDWNRAPQPIQIRLKCLRGVKDKLPASRYVLMVSLYNRLGGNVMKWSNLKGQQWGGATLPIQHDGEFFNIELKIDQSVFTVCPSRPDMRPGMLLVFELFILRGPVTPTDKVVGWGCFPICDAEFNVIDGKYRTPMLRGEMDPAIDKFEVIEKLMATDVENWLCNFYFEIIKLPRYMAGQKEYEVELQFTSGLLSQPDRTKTQDENIDGEKAIFGSRSDVNSPDLASRLSLRSGSINSQMLDENSNVGSIEKPPMLAVDEADGERTNSRASKRKPSPLPDAQVQLFRADHLSSALRNRKGSSVSHGDGFYGNIDNTTVMRPMTSVAASRKLVEERGLQLSDDDGADSSGTDYDEKDILQVKKEIGFRPVKGQPGMFYKVHYNTPSDVYARKVYTMMPKTPVLTKRKGKRKLTHLEELDTHSFNVKQPWSNKGHIEKKGRKKLQYMGRMMLSELGISQVKSREFWAMILMILITYWMRMYLHYIGQWVALLSFLIPINKFEFLPYTVNLNYQNTLLRTREEIALIVIGPFTNILLLAVMVLLALFIQFLFERFPNMFSRLLMAFGLHCIFDPFWILITDSAIARYENRGGDYPIGDAFKLYWHFDRYYNNDNVTLFVSIALTLFLYFVTTFSACTILYMYFLRIHNNGRLMDIYWRLHGKEGDFFIPYDLEISNEELCYVARKAEQWRGEEGERRKTAVYDYIWEEEEMADEDWDSQTKLGGKKTGAKETTTHVSIHTLHLDGLRELYRHFLKLPDGAIVEVFGEMNVPGIDEGVKQALIKRTTFQTVVNSSSKRRPSRNNSIIDINGNNKKASLTVPDGRRNSEFLEVPGSSSFV